MLLGLAACQDGAEATQGGARSPGSIEVRVTKQNAPQVPITPEPDATPAAPKPAAPKPLEAGQEIAIPKGRLLLGSATGSAFRNASREADAVEVELGGFSIDALPYPNDPAKPPRALVSRDEASALCRERGQRLCTEFEWERACKGESDQAYPASTYDPATCSDSLTSCASDFSVFALGTWGREWTSSRAGVGLGDSLRTAVVRGAAKSAAKELHRCAARDAATPDSKSESLLFRCCRGPVTELQYPEEARSEPFVEQSWDAAAMRELLSAMPETQGVAKDFKPFSPEQVNKSLLASGRSKTGLAPWLPATKGLVWSPLHGERIGVFSGDTKEGALLVAFYQDASGRPVFGASYLTQNEHNAIVVAYKPDVTKELLFSTCWGCGGEGGALELGADGRVRIAPR